MKKILFISYSNNNLTKVKLIKKELTDHAYFEPLIIAFNREPNKTLITKVTEGIDSSFAIIPILTRDSIKTQWINQEIGYSQGIKKLIYPIVESIILDDLKGFIHKQNDIPYTYQIDTEHIGQENKSFMSTFRLLLKDIEEDYLESVKLDQKSKTGLSLIEEKKVERIFNRKRRKFLLSDEGRETAKVEFLKLIDLLNNLKKEYRRRGIKADIEIDRLDVATGNEMAHIRAIFKAKGYSFHIGLVFYKTQESKLWVTYYRDSVRYKASWEDYEFGEEAFDTQYYITLLKDFSFLWRSIRSQKNKSSSEIVDMCSKWLAKEITYMY